MSNQNEFIIDEKVVTKCLEANGKITIPEGVEAIADGCFSKVRIYVWLEGNDPDCTVALASQYLMLNLAFFAKEITA